MKINQIIHEAGTGLEIDRSIPGRTIARISGDLAYRTGPLTDKKLPDHHDDYTPWSGKVGASTRDDEEDTFDIDYTGDDGELKEFVTPQAVAQDPGLEREKDVDVIFFGQMPRDFTADTVAEALEAVLPREYPPGSSNIRNSNVYRVVTEIAKHQGAVVTTKPLSTAQKLVKTFQTYGIKCKIDAPGLEEDITRRGFLQGAGAAAVAGAFPKGAKAQSPNFVQLANYAVQKANEIVTSYSSVMTAQRRSYFGNYTREEIYKQTVWYLNNTGGYNGQEVINYGLSIAKQECDNIKGGIGDMIGGAGLRDNMATKVVNTFVQTYASAMSQKVNEYKQQAGKQQQQQQAMGGLSKEELDTLMDGLVTYAILKDIGFDNNPMFTDVASALGNVIKTYNNKDYVNSFYPEVRQSVLQLKQNREAYTKEVSRTIDPKYIISLVNKLNTMASNKKPEFQEGMAEGAAGLPDPQNFDSDNDYYDALDAYGKPQDTDADYENMDETKEKIGNMDADAFDAALSRMKKLAGAGPLRTVYDPARRVYKNVPHAVQPAQQPKKAR